MEKKDMIGSDEYKAITQRYASEKSKIDYALLNKDFIQFAGKSKVVSEMVANKAGVDDIVLYIVRSRAAFLLGDKSDLDDAETAALIEALDGIGRRSAFKELKAHIKRLLAKGTA